MKTKRLHILFLRICILEDFLFLISMPCRSQEIIDSSRNYEISDYSFGLFQSTRTISIQPDTILAGKQYYRFDPSPIHSFIYREDTLGRIYRYDWTLNRDVVFLDWDKNIGDTLDKCIIHKKDTYMHGAIPRTQLTLRPIAQAGYRSRFVRGLGNTGGTYFMRPEVTYTDIFFCTRMISYNKRLDFLDTICGATVSINQYNDAQLKIHSIDGAHFVLQYNHSIDGRVMIWNSLGQLISSELMKKGECQILINDQAEGIYYVVIHDASDRVIYKTKLAVGGGKR